MTCMVFVQVSPRQVTTHVSTSPIFAGIEGFQQPSGFLRAGITTSIADEIDVMQEECGFYIGGSGHQHESVANLLAHYCIFLPPYNGEVDVPTAVFGFYSDLPSLEVE